MGQKLAIVTGTSSGIGASLTDRLLANGWQVFGIARREVKRPEEGYRHVQADLAQAGVAESTVGPMLDVETAFGDFDRIALVNNAALTGQMRSYGQQDAQKTWQMMAVNLAAPMAMMDMIIRHRPEGVPLRIVNISSGLAHMPLAGTADYCASKAGLLMASKVLAEEAGDSMGILSYEPGIVDTAMQGQLRGQEGDDFVSGDIFKGWHESGQLARPEDVVVPITNFLDDDRSGFYEARFGG